MVYASSGKLPEFWRRCRISKAFIDKDSCIVGEQKKNSKNMEMARNRAISNIDHMLCVTMKWISLIR